MAITVTLDLDNKKFKDGLKKAGVDVKKTGGQVDKLGKKVKKFNVDSAKLGIGLAAVFAGGVYGLSKFVNAAADLETVTTQFEVLTGSVSSAKDHVKDLVKFTAKTPFQFDQVAVASKRLHAFGIETEDIMARLQNLGDISAASGKNIGELATIFGQITAEGKLTGERLKQLEESAIPIGPALAKTMGVAQSSIRALVSQGKVDAGTFAEAMDSISQKGGLAFKGMIKLSKTWSGLMSTLSDNVSILSQQMGKRFLPAGKKVVANMIELISAFANNDKLVDFSAAALALITAVSGAGAAIIGVKVGLGLLASALGIAVLPAAILVAKFVLITGAVVAGAAAIYAYRKEISLFIQKAWNWIKMISKMAKLKFKNLFGIGSKEERKKQLDEIEKDYERARKEIEDGEKKLEEEKRKAAQKAREPKAGREMIAFEKKLNDERLKLIDQALERELAQAKKNGELMTQAKIDVIKKQYQRMSEAELALAAKKATELREQEKQELLMSKEDKLIRDEEELLAKEEHFRMLMEQDVLNEEEKKEWQAELYEKDKELTAERRKELLELSKNYHKITDKDEKANAKRSLKLLSDQHNREKQQQAMQNNFKIGLARQAGTVLIDLLGRESKAAFRIQQALNLSDIYMNTAAAFMRAVKLFPLSGGQPWAGVALGLGAAQAGIVLSQKPPQVSKAQKGGTVQRQPGTPSVGDYQHILAEANEVILPTDDVKMFRKGFQKIMNPETEDDFFKEDDNSLKLDINFIDDASSLLQASRREEDALGVGIV